MLRFGAGLAIALVMLPASMSLAQTTKPVEKAQPGVVPPLPENKAAKPGAAANAAPPVLDVWTPAEIAAAKSRCTAALKGLNVLVSYEEPIKDGECGDPAPVRLVKLDNVTFSPAALVNCGLLAPLHTWITRDLQPLAARQLRSRITSVEIMSDYSCRTALGRVGKKLSQHAYVDALDIRGFITDKGQQVSVLEGWGTTNREIAAAKAREEKIIRDAQASSTKTGQSGGDAGRPDSNASSIAGAVPGSRHLKPTRTDIDVVTVILPGGIRKQQMAARLGGPPDKTAVYDKPLQRAAEKSGTQTAAIGPATLAPAPNTPNARFLHEAHAAACRIFGTTLGPEANEMHRNHFHVDMAERKIKKICD